MKRYLALFLCVLMMISLVACGGKGDVASTGGAASSEKGAASSAPSSDSGADTGDDSGDRVPNLVIANDQIKERAVVYDLDAYQEGDTLEDLEVWSVSTGHAAGVKYREDTVFGDVVIVGGSKSAIYEYPSKREVWSTNNPGNNTHSIEILPSGNIVLANSTGNSLRFFYVSALKDGNATGAQRFVDYELKGAHGVLWDPEYEVLWALGGYELVAYAVTGEGTNQKLSLVQGMGMDISDLGYGHDLQADFTDSRYLYFTAGKAFRFDKDENKLGLFLHSDSYQQKEIKGFSSTPNDEIVSTGPLGGAGKFFEKSTKESWLTDTIWLFTKVERKGKVAVQKQEFVATESAFYKVRSFYGKYL